MSKESSNSSDCPEMDYFMNESMSDVVFIIDGQRLPAMKSLLRVKSKVFRAMFSGNYKESKDKVVVIKDTTFEAFKALIQYLYCERLVLKDGNDFELIQGICKLADRYEIFNILSKIGDHLKTMGLSDCPEMEFFMNESESDVVFIIDGQRLPALKSLLKVKSKVFRAMFSDKSKEGKEIVIKDTTFEAFKTLIQYLYCERLVLKDGHDFKLIFEVCQLSDRFETPKVLGKIVDHLKTIGLTFDNLYLISRIAFHHEIKDLMSFVMTFIDNNFEEFIEKDLKQMIDLNESTLDMEVSKLIALKYTQEKFESVRCIHCNNDTYKSLQDHWPSKYCTSCAKPLQ